MPAKEYMDDKSIVHAIRDFVDKSLNFLSSSLS